MGSPLGPMTSQFMSFWQSIPCFRWFKFNQKVTCHPTTALLRLLPQWTYGVTAVCPQGTQDKSVDDLLLQTLALHLPVLWKPSRRGSFQLSSCLIVLCPATEVCGVFSSGGLSPTSSGQPKAKAIAYIVLRVLCDQQFIRKHLTPDTNQLKRIISILYLPKQEYGCLLIRSPLMSHVYILWLSYTGLPLLG